jgi:hypothetical protein
MAGLRRKLERERDEAKAEAQKLIEANKTAEDKAREQREKEIREGVEKTLRSEMLQKEIRSEIRLKLAEAGVPANQVAVILEESKPETVEDAATAATAYAAKWKTDVVKPATPTGQGGSPTPTPSTDRPWTTEKVNRVRSEKGEKYINEHWSEIMQDLNGGQK